MIDATNAGIMALGDRQSALFERRGFIETDIAEKEQELQDLKDKIGPIDRQIDEIAEVLKALETPRINQPAQEAV